MIEKKMTHLLYEFINKYVMCKNCNNPETEFDYKKEQIINCNACGYNNKMKIKKKINKNNKKDNQNNKKDNQNENNIEKKNNLNNYFIYDELDIEIDNL